jgi:hypothetical protein
VGSFRDGDTHVVVLARRLLREIVAYLRHRPAAGAPA